MPPESAFEVAMESDLTPGTTLVVGVSQPGMAGITAADYLVRHLDTERIGHIAPEALPAIAPFEEGEPRHHTRLYNVIDSELTVLVGELFIPVWAARPFADALFEWGADEGLEEVAVLHGVPFPHGPDEHTTFHVSTPEYRERRLEAADVEPLKGGFLDGVAGEIVTRSLSGEAPPVGVYITPSHPPGPDVDAALLLLDAVQDVYGFAIDMEELRAVAEDVRRYYAGLAEGMAAMESADAPTSRRDYPEDRMYM